MASKNTSERLQVPSFNQLPFQDDTGQWDGFKSLENDSGTLQNASSTFPAVQAAGHPIHLNSQHDHLQNQTFGGPMATSQLALLDSFCDLPYHLSNNACSSDFEDDRQFLGSQSKPVMESFVNHRLPIGVPTVDQLESFDVSIFDSGPQYQEPIYDEFFNGLDLFQDAEIIGTFDPGLSHQAKFPQAEPSERMAILPEFPEAYRDEVHVPAANFEDLFTSPNLFSQSIWDGDSSQWILPQLPMNGLERFDQTTKRPSSYDDHQPSKRPRHHQVTPNIYQTLSLNELAQPNLENPRQRSKRPISDADLPTSKRTRAEQSMTSEYGKPPHDTLSQASDKVIAEILLPSSPRIQSQLVFPSNLTQAEGSGAFHVFQVKAPKSVAHETKSNSTRTPAQSPENVCLQCKIRKKQCVPATGLPQSQSACKKCLALANGDESVAKTFCVRPKDLELKLVNPDVYFDSYLAINRQMSTPVSPNVQRRVAIHMTCLVTENPHLPSLWKSAALICNVEEHKVKGSDAVAIDMLHYQTFYDLRYAQVGGPHSRRMPSVEIPEGQIPKLSNLVRWATSTLALAPNGAVFGLQGPIYQFASCYIEKEHRPLRGLVELALRYTAIYNVCIGQMSVQLSPASPVLYKIPPKLRVQICGPLIQQFMELGEQLQKSMLKALYSRHGPEKEELVPLCTVWWLLMTVYHHNLNDSAMPASICYAAEKIDLNYLEAREKAISNLAINHQAIYHALFRRDPKSLCPIFINALVKLCGIEGGDADLLEKLECLRTAMRHFKEDAKVRRDILRAQDKLDDLTDLFGAIELGNHQPLVAALDDTVDAKTAEVVDKSRLMPSTQPEPSRNLGQGSGESQPEAKAAELSVLRDRRLASWILQYDNQSWLFGY